MFTLKQLEILNQVEDASCKYCGRVVLAGPPCCYKAVYDLWLASQQEVKWLRKIQSKQAKRIQNLCKK